MTETLLAEVYESEHKLYIEALGSLFLEVGNSVARDPSDYWKNEDEFIRVDANEGYVNATHQFLLEDMGEKVDASEKIELITQGETTYLIGFSEVLPAGSPFYVMHTESEEVYEVHDVGFGGRDYDADKFLGETDYEDAVRVKNVRTKQARPMDKEVFKRQFSANEVRLVLPINGL